MGLWQVGGEMGSVWEGCWGRELMVRTGVQHVRGGGREPKCGMSAHGVSGALGVQGSGGFGTVWGVCGHRREGIWSVSQICVVVINSGAGLQVWRGSAVVWVVSSDRALRTGGEDQLGECLQTGSGGRWGMDGVRSGLVRVRWMQCLWSGCRVRHLVRRDCIYCAFVDLERSFEGVPEF